MWRASLDERPRHVARVAGTLSPDELRRADRFRSADDRERFVLARGLLRSLLGRYLGRDPASLRFCYGPAGKPELRRHADGGDVHFNYSHSQDLILCAIARGRRVGVDVEARRPIEDFDGVAIRSFSVREREEWHALHPLRRHDAFFQAWTRKEAYLKAVGDGLIDALDRIEVAVARREHPLLVAIDGDPSRAAGWCVEDLPVGRGYAAALAVEGDGHQTNRWQYEARGGTG